MQTSPLKAIHLFCIDCSGGSRSEVKHCTGNSCPLFAFRFGKNPYIKREMTDEQRAAAKVRLAEARNKQKGETANGEDQ